MACVLIQRNRRCGEALASPSFDPAGPASPVFLCHHLPMTTMHSTLFLDNVAFYGRTLREYRAFFQLTYADLQQRRILDCGAGCASLNAEGTRAGADIVSVDPLYNRNAAALSAVARHDIAKVLDRAQHASAHFVFRFFRDLDEVAHCRRNALERFLEDYAAGRAQGRYRAAKLPHLPFADHAFDLALCGHFLLLYGYQYGADFHLHSLRELLRVAREVRVYPLLQPNGEPPSFLEALLGQLRDEGITTDLVPLEYEFLRGAHTLLRLHRVKLPSAPARKCGTLPKPLGLMALDPSASL